MEALRPTKILVVEDDAADSYMLIRQIEKAQIDDHVTVVSDGKEALKSYLAKSEPPLAIFLDLKLPGITGVEVLERIRGDTKLHDVPVIIMTGSVSPSDESRCNRLGVTAVLVKPIGLTTFIKTVSHLFPKATPSD